MQMSSEGYTAWGEEDTAKAEVKGGRREKRELKMRLTEVEETNEWKGKKRIYAMALHDTHTQVE